MTNVGPVRRFGLALGVVGVLGFGGILAACSTPSQLPKPTAVTDESFPADASLPPDLSLPPEDSAEPDDSLGPDDSDAPFAPGGMFTHGTATITFATGDPKTVTLPHLAADTESTFDTDLGISIAWRGGDWAIHFDSAVPTGDPTFTLTITREDTDPPLSADGSACTVTFTAQTEDHVAGKAVCPGLVWDDAFADELPDATAGAPTPAASPPFDATITFDATP